MNMPSEDTKQSEDGTTLYRCKHCGGFFDETLVVFWYEDDVEVCGCQWCEPQGFTHMEDEQ